MSVKSCEKLEKSTVALTVEVSAADFEAAIERTYRKQRGKLRIPGFRPGKAPRKMIEHFYGANVFYEDAINDSFPEVYEAAVKEQDLHVVGYPQVELKEAGPQGYTIVATVAVYPEVTLGQYKGLEVPRMEVSVSDEAVENRLKAMAERNSRVVDLDRAAENGDIVNINYKGYMDGVPFDGGEDKEFDLELGSGAFIPGFEDQLVGISAGESRDINVTFPENYNEKLAGKPAAFHVEANAVKRKEVPALDDDFAVDVSEFDTLEELRQDVRRTLTEEQEEIQRRAFEDAAIRKAAEGITCDVPDAMVEEEAKRRVENFARQIEARGMDFKDYLSMGGTTVRQLLDEAAEPSREQVRIDLTAKAIADAENIEATDEEVEKEYEKMTETFNADLETVKKYVTDEVVRNQVRYDKAVALVAESAVPIAPPVEEKAGEPAPGEAAGE